MISLLARLFIRNSQAHTDPDVRRRYGVLCSGVGIGLNVLLFAAKYAAGVLSGSVAIMADAANNLSDAGSSVITLLGFRLAGRRPDREHPFGHGRIEYIAGLAVSVLVIVMGVELAKTSVAKILAPAPVTMNAVSVAILAAAIVVKGYMYLYNRRYAKLLDSSAMAATAADSLSDAASTAAVLAAMLIGHFTSLRIDGWCGLLVAAFVLYNGYTAARDTLSPLLGQAPSPDFVKSIEEIVLAHEDIEGIHDLVVHDYGPGRVLISLHAEVPASGDILELHDTIDTAERELVEKLGCHAVIHMDPISSDDSRVSEIRAALAEDVKTIDPALTIHDLRLVEGPTHTNIIFDVVTPPDFPLTDGELETRIDALVAARWDNCFAVVTVDKAYV